MVEEVEEVLLHLEVMVLVLQVEQVEQELQVYMLLVQQTQ